MPGRKSQIAYFILFGFILMTGAFFIFYFNDLQSSEVKREAEITSLSSGKLQVENFMNECLKQAILDSIRAASLSGSYFSLPKSYVNISGTLLPYYFIDRIKNYPSKEVVDKELAMYVESYAAHCKSKLLFFKEQGLKFELKEPKAVVDIQRNHVIVNLNYEINVDTPSNSSFRLGQFRYDLETKFGLLYWFAANLADEQAASGRICLNCMSKALEESNISMEFYRHENSFIFIFQDNSSKNREPLAFVFAGKYGKYSCKNLPPDDLDFIGKCAETELESKNYSFYIKNIPKQFANVDDSFHYKVDAGGLNLTYHDYTDLFEINPKTGIIEFVPSTSQKGNHTVWLGLKDALGNTAYKNFELEVI